MPLDFGAIRGTQIPYDQTALYNAALQAQEYAGQAALEPFRAIERTASAYFDRRDRRAEAEREHGDRLQLLREEMRLRGDLVDREAQARAAGDLLVEQQKAVAEQEAQRRQMELFAQAVEGRGDMVETKSRPLIEATPFFGMPYEEAIKGIMARTPGADREVAAELYKGLTKKVPVVRAKDPSGLAMKRFELLQATGSALAADDMMKQIYGSPAANEVEELAQLYKAGGEEFPQFFPRTSIQAPSLTQVPSTMAGNVGTAQPYRVGEGNYKRALGDWSQIPDALIEKHFGQGTDETRRMSDALRGPQLPMEIEAQGLGIAPIFDAEGNLSDFTLQADDPRFAALVQDYANVNPAVRSRFMGLLQAGGADITDAQADKLEAARRERAAKAKAPEYIPGSETRRGEIPRRESPPAAGSAEAPPAAEPSDELNLIEKQLGEYLKKARGGR